MSAAVEEIVARANADAEQREDLDGPRTWQPVDLAAVLDGTWCPPRPTVGRRNDGAGLFYPASVSLATVCTFAG